MPQVSIILPYFKKKLFIKNSLKSVLNQSFKDFEIIIIYDDKYREDLLYIREIIKLDKRIKLIVNKDNIGAGLSRNKGVKKSSGKFICFIDADDLWKKNKLKYQINFMKKNNYHVSHTSYEILNIKKKKISFRKAKIFRNYKELLWSCDIGLSSVMLRKEIFKRGLKFPNTKTKEDFILWLNILKKGYKIYSLDKNLMSWIKTPNSLSSSTLQKFKDSFILYNNYMKFNILKSLLYTFILSVNFLIKNI